MSAERQMLLDTAARIFSGGAPPEILWREIAQAGLPGLLVAESAGGFGGDFGDAFAVIRLAGFYALGPDLGEAIIGAAFHGSAHDRIAIAEAADGTFDGETFTGILRGVSDGRAARLVLAAIDGQVIAIRTENAVLTPGETIAGDPRDSLHCEHAAAALCPVPAPLLALGALSRIAAIAGALDAALALAIRHANERQQFGKPIGKFQAVQQNLAIMAEHAAAVSCAGQAAFDAAGHALSRQDRAEKFDPEFEIAAAKLRANIAVDIGASIAHQVHGAIGFTNDHQLHRFTRRLYAWRAQFGNERHWAERLGALTAAAGADLVWPALTDRADAVAESIR